jgi:hypothetical protein
MANFEINVVDEETDTRIDDFLEYVNGTDRKLAADCYYTAEALVSAFVRAIDVPRHPLEQAIRECASELWHRRNAPNGIQGFSTPDGESPVRIARDPMIAARAILKPFLPLGFA